MNAFNKAFDSMTQNRHDSRDLQTVLEDAIKGRFSPVNSNKAAPKLTLK